MFCAFGCAARQRAHALHLPVNVSISLLLMVFEIASKLEVNGAATEPTIDERT